MGGSVEKQQPPLRVADEVRELGALVFRSHDHRVRRPHAMVVAPEDERAEFADFISHAQRWLLFLDAPAHTRLRKLMNRGFAPLTVAKLRPRVAAAVDELLSKAQSGAHFDAIGEFAYPLPVRIISELLGVPESLYDRCIALSTDIANWLGNLRRLPEDARRTGAAVKDSLAISTPSFVTAVTPSARTSSICSSTSRAASPESRSRMCMRSVCYFSWPATNHAEPNRKRDLHTVDAPRRVAGGAGQIWSWFPR